MNRIGAITFQDVSKRFKDRVLFSSFSATFKAGSLNILMGPSGCGKTTLLNRIYGKENATDGYIRFNGQKRGRKRKREISYLPSDQWIIRELSVKDNLRLITDDEGKIAGVLAKVGLNGKDNERGNQLSKGESLRLALARIILEEKDVVLLDEPTGNLDEENAGKIFALIKEISKGRIVIVTSHDKRLSQKYGDSLFVYRNGSILKEKACDTITIKTNRAKEKNETHRIPFDLTFKLRKSRLIKNRKQSVLVFILILVLNIIGISCFSFMSSDAGKLISREMDECGIEGMQCEKYRSDNPDSAKLTIGFVNSKSDSYPIIFNSGNLFQTKDDVLNVSNKDGIIVPSSLAEEYKLSIGNYLSLDLVGTAIKGQIESIYPSKERDQNKAKQSTLFSNRKDEAIKTLQLRNNPIRVASGLINKQSLQYLKGYASSDFFKKKRALNSIPYILEAWDHETREFWMAKDSFNLTCLYILSGVLLLELLSLLFYCLGLNRSFKNNIRILRTVKGNSDYMFFFFFLFLLILFTIPFLCSIPIGILTIPDISSKRCSFFFISNYLPVMCITPAICLFLLAAFFLPLLFIGLQLSLLDLLDC